jgi:4-amino-4-deoxy-L-arabinose transferase-like glycosyltransferase
MKKDIKRLLWVIVSFVLVKVIISYFIPSSRAFSDDYQYLKLAESFFYHFSFEVHGLPTLQYYPLYPILISISYLFKDNTLTYLIIKMLNSIFSSLIIIPSYLLAREFLSKKRSLFISIFIGLLPSNFSLMSYVMAENLFYSLFLFSIYFIYKSFSDKELKYYILAGILVGLTFLTRINGIILIILVVLLILLNIFTRRFDKKSLIIPLVSFMIIAPWLLHNLSSYNIYSKESLILLQYQNRIYPFVIWFMSYIGFITLASGFIFAPLFALSFKIKNPKMNLFRNISLITILLTLILATNHNLRTIKYIYKLNNFIFVAGRPIGRYVDFILPLIVIIGFVGLNYYLENKKKINDSLLKKAGSVLTFIMLISTHLIFRPLVPFNNVSLTIFGFLKYLIDLIFYSKTSFESNITLASFIIIGLIFIFISLLSYNILKKFNHRTIISFLLAFVIISSLISLGVICYASKTSWYYNSEQRELALYLNSIDKKRSLVLIDERDYGDLGGSTYDSSVLYGGTNQSRYTVLGYWLNDELIIGDINSIQSDYIISKANLNLEKLYSTKNGIYLYKKQ